MSNTIVRRLKLLSEGHWYLSEVWQGFGCQATASRSPKSQFLQKHRMASRGLVLPNKNVGQKTNVLILVNHYRNAKFGASEISKGPVRAIFVF